MNVDSALLSPQPEMAERKKAKITGGFDPNPAILWVNSSQLLVGGSCLCFTTVKVIFIP